MLVGKTTVDGTADMWKVHYCLRKTTADKTTDVGRQMAVS